LLERYFDAKNAPQGIAEKWEKDLLQIGGGIPGSDAVVENQQIDAGWTYFGQLLAHDITYKRQSNLNYVATLDLNSVCGKGPVAGNGVFSFIKKKPELNGALFALEQYKSDNEQDVVYDFKRRKDGKNIGVPIIYDTRHDDNYIISQLVCTLKRFHNAIAEYLFASKKLANEELYQATRSLVCKSYHDIILYDYLPKLLMGGQEFVNNLLSEGAFKFINPRENPPRLMQEFNIAAFRMGHSQVREFYHIHSKFNTAFSLWGTGGDDNLRGFKRNTARPSVKWPLFFTFPEEKSTVQKSLLIDLIITKPLGELPFNIKRKKGENNLGRRNIQQSVQSNQVFSRSTLERLSSEKGIAVITNKKTGEDVTEKNWIIKIKNVDFFPLWCYILLEARLLGGHYEGALIKRQNLGPLGSHIIGEQIVWTILHSQFYKNKEMPSVALSLNIPHFSMSDLVTVAEKGVVNHPAYQNNFSSI